MTWLQWWLSMPLWEQWMTGLTGMAITAPILAGIGARLIVFEPDPDSAPRKSDEDIIAESRPALESEPEIRGDFAYAMKRGAQERRFSAHPLELPSPEPDFAESEPYSEPPISAPL